MLLYIGFYVIYALFLHSLLTLLDRSPRLRDEFLIFWKILKARILIFQMSRLRASIYNSISTSFYIKNHSIRTVTHTFKNNYIHIYSFIFI